MKRRRLEAGQNVILVYLKARGFISEPATFLQYKRIILNDVHYEIPVFDFKNEVIDGLECFWVLPEDAKSEETIQRIQYELIKVQIAAQEIGLEMGIEVPKKIKDKEITKMAQANTDRIKTLIQKLGFDPRDESWIEVDLANTDRERNWFAFERKNPLLFAKKWDEMTAEFNRQYKDNLSADEAKNLSKKRVRYLLGAFHTRQSGNANRHDWVSAAKDFEQKHRDVENRMLTWSGARNPNFPLVKVLKPLAFTAGPYFHECIEKIPHVFTDSKINKIKDGVALRVVSYDPVEKYIRLDFTPDVRKLIKGLEDSETKPWEKHDPDYNIWLKPEEIQTHIRILEKLE